MKDLAKKLGLLFLFHSIIGAPSAWCGQVEKVFDIGRDGYLNNFGPQPTSRNIELSCALIIRGPDENKVDRYGGKGLIARKMTIKFEGTSILLDGIPTNWRSLDGNQLEIIGFFGSEIGDMLSVRKAAGAGDETTYLQLSVIRGQIEAHPRYDGSFFANLDNRAFVNLGYGLCSASELITSKVSWTEEGNLQAMLKDWVTSETRELDQVLQRAEHFNVEDQNLLRTFGRIKARRRVPGLRDLRKYFADNSGDLSPRSERAYKHILNSNYGSIPKEIPIVDSSAIGVQGPVAGTSTVMGVHGQVVDTTAVVGVHDVVAETPGISARDPVDEPEIDAPIQGVKAPAGSGEAAAKHLGERKFVLGDFKSPSLKRFMRVAESELHLKPALTQK